MKLNKLKKVSFAVAGLMLLVILIEALPFGVELSFAEHDGSVVTKAYSYFSLTPLGYAHFGALPAALLSVFAFIFAIAFCIKEKKIFVFLTATASALSFLFSLFLFISGGYTWISAVVSILLAFVGTLSLIKYAK